VPDQQLSDEVFGSRQDLERDLESPVRTFAYPYGRYDDRAVAAVEQAGFAAACTTVPRLVGLDENPLLIPRVEIKAFDSLPRFVLKLLFAIP
jgi:peptidoglycan/xylan/chitin deacetylase (PgdA/CDA1 family)